VARDLGIAEATVKIHVQHILRKLNLNLSSRCSACRRRSYLAWPGRAGAHGQRFPQRRKQILLLVLVVMARGRVEVAQDRQGGLLRLRVGAVLLQMGGQSFQRVALLLHPAVAGGEHLQRHFKAHGGGMVAGQGVGHGGALGMGWRACAWPAL
jgi:hypothetical protein